MIRVRAFAKINLSLRVIGVLAGGDHELRTIFQSVSLYDTLTIRRTRGPFWIVCDDPACPADSTNLVWRAAEAVWAASGRSGSPRNVGVTLTKQIPIAAGLGGGSSDAAAALRARSRRCGRSMRGACPTSPRRSAPTSVASRGRHGARSRPRRRAVSADRSAEGVGGARGAVVRRQHEATRMRGSTRTRPRRRGGATAGRTGTRCGKRRTTSSRRSRNGIRKLHRSRQRCAAPAPRTPR